MRFNFSERCVSNCVLFEDRKTRVENAGDIENSALADRSLIDEGEFTCDGPRDSSDSNEMEICMGRITKIPNIKNRDLVFKVETILGPIAVDALADGD